MSITLTNTQAKTALMAIYHAVDDQESVADSHTCSYVPVPDAYASKIIRRCKANIAKLNRLNADIRRQMKEK